MAIEQVFVDPRTLKRFRDGPLASKLDGFCEWLSKRGLYNVSELVYPWKG